MNVRIIIEQEMSNLKFYIIGLLIATLIGLGVAIKLQSDKIKQLNTELLVSMNNNKAYEAERDSLKDNVIQFQFTVDQLNHSKDSLLNRLNEIRKQLKIKDKEINELQYFASLSQKADSIIVHDTIFQKGVVLDTLIGDDWSSLAVHAEYPGILNVDYSFKNSTVVLMHNSRVTVDPPKKCWLLRLFQKKQTIVEIDVVQENPYCINQEQKFLKIIK